jgi:glycosyltransferase involved in cell wall biosynthesis
MTTHPPLVSVVIPTFNQPAYLVEAINSVLRQSLEDREVIVVNDGSTDNTLETLSAFGEQIRVVSQANSGIGVARNRGIAEASGKFVALLDHDDYWAPRKLAEQVDFLEKNPECIAATVPYANSNAPEISIFDPDQVSGPDRIVRDPFFHLARGRLFMGTSALMFDRARAAGLQYGVMRNAVEDVQFHIGLISRGLVGIAGHSVLAVWRVHQSNASRKRDYTYLGMKLLRAMDARGELGNFTGLQRRHLDEYLCQLGRVASVQQLLAGNRFRGFEMYFREFVHQALICRISFLLGYPLLLLMPHAMIVRCYARRRMRQEIN